MADMHPEIRRAMSEPEGVRLWALASAAAMVFVDDPEADPIFAKLSGPERMRLGRCITRASLAALTALAPTTPSPGE